MSAANFTLQDIVELSERRNFSILSAQQFDLSGAGFIIKTSHRWGEGFVFIRFRMEVFDLQGKHLAYVDNCISSEAYKHMTGQNYEGVVPVDIFPWDFLFKASITKGVSEANANFIELTTHKSLMSKAELECVFIRRRHWRRRYKAKPWLKQAAFGYINYDPQTKRAVEAFVKVPRLKE